MYNVGDRVQFINLKGSSWEKSCATVEKKIDENLFWFRRDDGKGGIS
ncbi:hypothetical protein KpnPVR7901_45 [Klebsiella phage KpnP_VR7901]|nr:hypothetical protein KpnPVR7901_45 [Klebsiella phage KpnP_VR7901]